LPPTLTNTVTGLKWYRLFVSPILTVAVDAAATELTSSNNATSDPTAATLTVR
jgi:hypothetical protein